jgi:uncharacterized repeat protein (TIGR01451 family)
VNDTIPTDTTYVGSSATLDSFASGVYSFKFTDVAPGPHSFTVTVRVKVGTADETKLTNTADMEYTDSNGNGYTPQSDDAVVWVTAPEIVVVKNANVDTADPEDLIVYTIYYNNTGTGVAALVWINDTIPTDTTYVGSSATLDSASSGVYSFKFTNVAPGDHSFTVTVKVKVGTADETKLTNTADMEYTDSNGNGYTPQSDDAVVWVTAPGVSVVKNANVDTADPEDLIVYTIYYNNTGSGTAAVVWVNDTIPTDTTYVGSSATLDSFASGVYSFKFTDVAPGPHSFTVTVKVKVGTADETKLTNTADMEYTDSNGNGFAPQSDDAVVWVTAPEVSVVKNANVDTADPEDLIVYTIYYNNTGTGTAAIVWVNDTIPTDTTYVGSSATLDSSSGGMYSYKFTNVAPGSHSFTVTVRVKVGIDDGTKLVNTAVMEYTDSNGNGYAPQSDSATVWVTAPEITVVKNANVDTADPEDLIIYTIYYNNTGTGTAALVWVNDTIPTDTTYVGSSAVLDSSSGGVYSYKFTNVAPGSHSFTVTVKVKVGTADETKLTNTADMEYTDTNGNGYTPLSDSATVWVTAPEVSIVKNANVDDADPEDLIVYTIYYNNTGTGTAAVVWVNDTLPADVSFEGSSETPDSFLNNFYSFKFTNVAPGDHSFTITVKVKVGTADKAMLLNTAVMEYTDSNGNGYTPQSDDATVWATAPIITITKVPDWPTADPFDIITYTITYINSGTGTAAVVWINDTIPINTTFISGDPAPDYNVGKTYTWQETEVEPGTYYITLKVRVDTGTPDKTVMTNYITLDYTDSNGNGYPQENDTATVTVTAPVLYIEKDPDVTKADPDDYITYTIEYTNNGTGNSSIIYINDTIPTDTDYISSTETLDSVNSGVYSWKFTDVAPGTYSFDVTVKVKPGTDDKTVLLNLVTMDYSNANNQFYPQLSDTATVTVTAPIIELFKVVDVFTADPEDSFVYTIYYNNTGTGYAGLVWINDTLPADVTVVGTSETPDSFASNFYSFKFTDVAPGPHSFTITVKVKVGTDDETILLNEAEMDYTDTNYNGYTPQEDTATVVVTAPEIEVVKNANVDTADPEDLIVYTIYYNNTGTGVSALVWINDTIPADTTYVGSSATLDSSASGVYSFKFTDVAPGPHSFTITVRVKVGTADETKLFNKADMKYTDANGNGYNPQSDDATVWVTAPEIELVKNANVDTADPEDLIIYTIYYNNTGTGVAALVWINDTLPTDVTFEGSSETPDSFSGNFYSFKFTNVAPGDHSFTITVKVKVGTADETKLLNTANMDYTDSNGNGYTPQSDDATVWVTSPEIEVVKNANVDDADPEDLIVYTIYYNNTGTGVAALIWINDTIPTDTTYVGSSAVLDSSSSGVYSYKFTNVAPGDHSFTVTVRVKVGTADETQLVNTADMEFTDSNGNGYTPQTDTAVVWVTAPEIELVKNSNVDTADPEDVIVYTIYYNNTGTGTAALVWINDTLPVDVIFEGSSETPDSYASNFYSFKFTDVAPGLHSFTITVRVKVDTPDETKLYNKVDMDWTDANGNGYTQQTEDATVWVTAPEIELVKNANVDDADPEDVIVYTIYYNNTGTGVAALVWINDTLPADVAYEGSSETPDSFASNFYSFKFTDVAPGLHSFTITVRVKVGTADETKLFNEADMDWTDANGNGYTPQSEDATVWVTAPEIELVKNANVDDADPEDLIVYTIYYNNTGTGVAALVWINDTLPADVTFVGSSETPESNTSSFYSFKFTNVGPGLHSFTITVRVKVGTDDETKLFNEADMDYTDSNGNGYTPQSEDATVWVTAPEIELVKNSNVDTADPEDVIVYTIYYNNTGTGTAALVWINDTLPADVTFEGSSETPDSFSANFYSFKFTDVVPGDHSFTITVRVKVGTDDETKLFNNAGMDYHSQRMQQSGLQHLR